MAVAVAGFFVFDAFVDVLGALRQQGVDEPGEFVGDGCDGGWSIHARGHAATGGTERGLAVF